GAQTITDEFISSGEQKWGQLSGIGMLLPHGYEGQGPDHSSARVERYLQLSAQNNMTVAMPSTPASYFHLLRWHTLAPHHKPLIVFTPKSMLRLKAATSKAQDFTSGSFRPVIPDDTVDPAAVRKVLLCAGKVSWDLIAGRAKAGREDVAIVRLERLYPLPGNEIRDILADYPADAELVWVQEEPMNQGAFQYISVNLPEFLDGRPIGRVSRAPSASPATGSHKAHEIEQAAVVAEAIGG
ncbi:MAG TPA: multifunctional oxoglutarate decarboxylase/oxoglutarate dehydrogenase thiamine pyrophosphate-binding subunit/dihydrolipoyllysine-residue succinyltransferase subunit, partial [Actinomycetota bacterium]|nr:multifunctional oxoglutarate decarboxylase/oxoglutarate dehydrogenase thiamine pyrophosphate-binding subunit/dihydrolipoyllysine-residue succinyltransferase subunit [Actinomycetota bacterium]